MKHFYENIQGWFGFEKLYTNIVNELKDGSHIVEVGAWKGRSTAFLAVEIINSNKNIKLDVVDTWTGDVNDPNSFWDNEEFVAHNRNIFELFKSNLNPVIDKINPLQMTSADASKLYDDKSLDFVFIDACHEYNDVKLDIESSLPKIKTGGIMGGDDYNPISFPGVIKAVNEKFPNNFSIIEGSWLVRF